MPCEQPLLVLRGHLSKKELMMLKLNSGYIYIKGARFHAYIGVDEQEQVVGNEYVADLRLRYPISNAILTDDVSHTINYAEVYDLIRKVISRKAKLLEHTAGMMVQELGRAFPKIESIDLKLTKLNPPMGADCEGAGVELHLINDKTEDRP